MLDETSILNFSKTVKFFNSIESISVLSPNVKKVFLDTTELIISKKIIGYKKKFSDRSAREYFQHEQPARYER